jgi:glycosyltransferase involved in cell wall biosynthesis
VRVLLINDYGHQAGGAETYVFALQDLLRAKGHTVRLVADAPRLIHYASRVFNPWYFFKFLGIYLAWRPDVIHIHKYNLVYSFLPALVGKLLGIRVIVTLHDVGLFCPDGLGLLPDGAPCRDYLGNHCFSRKCYRTTSTSLDIQRRLNFVRNRIQVPIHNRTVATFLCPSRSLRDWAAHYHGDRARLLPYFTTMPATIPPPPPAAPPLQVFFAGRIVREKGLQFAIPALAGLPVELVIAGDGPYRAELEKVARLSGVVSQVKWLGKIPNADVPKHIAASHACILPSLWIENNPLFGYEAMKCARVLLGADVGGIPDMIEEGVNGHLFPKGDVAGVAAAYEKLLAAPDRIAVLGRNGLEKARRDYDPDEHHRLLMDIYSGVKVKA